jgi:hypothetical protein
MARKLGEMQYYKSCRTSSTLGKQQEINKMCGCDEHNLKRDSPPLDSVVSHAEAGIRLRGILFQIQFRQFQGSCPSMASSLVRTILGSDCP